MIPAYSVLAKSLSPTLMSKIATTFDRLTLWVVSICWLMTLVVMLAAIYTISLASAAKKEADAALATEPTLPTIKHGSVNGKELQVMIDRLQRRYPDVSIAWKDNTLSIGARDGGKYHQWLTAIGQVDTIYPQFHWKIKDFCVGTGCTGTPYLMSVDMVGDRVAFEMPQKGEKK